MGICTNNTYQLIYMQFILRKTEANVAESGQTIS